MFIVANSEEWVWVESIGDFAYYFACLSIV